MYSDEEYNEEEEEEVASGGFLKEFYNNNKKLIWIAGGIIILVIVLSLFSGSGGKSGTYITNNGSKIETLVLSKNNSATLEAVIDGNSNVSVEWSSDDNSVATVSGGMVRALAIGKTTINAKETNGSKKASCEIRVIEGDSSVRLTDIKFPEGDFLISVGSKSTLSLIPTPSNGYIENMVFQSSAPDIVRVSQDGTIEGVKAGSARIMVNVNNNAFNKGIMVRVVEKNVTPRIVKSVGSLTFTSTTDKIGVGQTKKLDFKVNPTNADEATILWESANENIVKVDEEGNITGINAGTAVVRARSLSANSLGSITITVEDNFTISVNPAYVTVNVGSAQYVTVTLNPSSSSRNSLTVETSDINIATAATNDNYNTIQIGGIKVGSATVIIKSNGVEKVRIPVTVINNVGGGGGGSTTTNNDGGYNNKGYKISSKDSNGEGFLNYTYAQAGGKGNCGKGPLTITFSDFNSSIDKLRVCKYEYGKTACDPDKNGTIINSGGKMTITTKGDWVILVSEYKGDKKVRNTLEWHACLKDSGTSSSSEDEKYACYVNVGTQGVGGLYKWMKGKDRSANTAKTILTQSQCSLANGGQICFKDSAGVYHWDNNYSVSSPNRPSSTYVVSTSKEDCEGRNKTN